jgi:hypothetical protein
MTDKSVALANARYGPVGFAVALVNILVVDLATWLFVVPLPLSALLVFPISLAYTGICAVVAKAPGRWGEVGRGMFLGSLAAPLSLIVFIPAFVIAHAIGPL